jgi:hypothetical protein
MRKTLLVALAIIVVASGSMSLFAGKVAVERVSALTSQHIAAIEAASQQ